MDLMAVSLVETIILLVVFAIGDYSLRKTRKEILEELDKRNEEFRQNIDELIKS